MTQCWTYFLKIGKSLIIAVFNNQSLVRETSQKILKLSDFGNSGRGSKH